MNIVLEQTEEYVNGQVSISTLQFDAIFLMLFFLRIREFSSENSKCFVSDFCLAKPSPHIMLCIGNTGAKWVALEPGCGTEKLSE